MVTPRQDGSRGAQRRRLRGAAALLFAPWIAGCASPPADAPHADAERGRQLLRDYGCAGCHTIPGVIGADGRVGPPLWALGDRGYIAGVLPNSDRNLRRWIVSPTAVNPRTAMPDAGVTEEDAAHMAVYLRSLRAEPVGLRMVRGFIERAMGRRAPDLPAPDGEGGG